MESLVLRVAYPNHYFIEWLPHPTQIIRLLRLNQQSLVNITLDIPFPSPPEDAPDTVVDLTRVLQLSFRNYCTNLADMEFDFMYALRHPTDTVVRFEACISDAPSEARVVDAMFSALFDTGTPLPVRASIRIPPPIVATHRKLSIAVTNAIGSEILLMSFECHTPVALSWAIRELAGDLESRGAQHLEIAVGEVDFDDVSQLQLNGMDRNIEFEEDGGIAVRYDRIEGC